TRSLLRKIIFAISGRVFRRILPPPDALLPQFAHPRAKKTSWPIVSQAHSFEEFVFPAFRGLP
ncbi:MAG TPA: hypothetical protein VL996_10955, partial [Methylocella sp.]|nr:hypothetical protein [Methylocella sp.]